jgi:hypothetical protein
MKLLNLIPQKEINFRNQDAFDDYNSQHQLRPDTKVTIAGKTTTAGQAAQSSTKVKGTSVFGNDGGAAVFGEKEPSEDFVNAITDTKSGYVVVRLSRKNRNGKIVPDTEFTQKDITSELIKKTLEDNDIDINLVNSFGAETKIKNSNGRMQPFHTFIRDLVMKSVELNQYAPGGKAEDERYYNVYELGKDAMVEKIKKIIDPKGIQKQADRTLAKAESDKNDLYNDETTKDLTNALSKVKNKIIFSGTFTTKDVAKVANKYKIDVNRILQHPEMYFDISGYTPTKEDLKDLGYKSLSEYALVQMGNTIYFGKSGDTDSMDDLSNLQLAYPLKYKTLSDDEWNKTMQNELENPTTVDGGLRNFIKKERGSDTNNSFENISETNNKNQSNWVKEQAKKNPNYINDMISYQSMINKDALNRIDGMLKSDPPPPVQTNALYRGMAMTPKDYSNFMKSFKEGSNIDLPISSFSFDATTATEFANNVGNANALVNKANNQSVMIKVVNSKNTFNGFCMNANIDNVSAKKDNSFGNSFGNDFSNWSDQHEVLLPSNNKYKVVKTESTKMQGSRSLTIITLEQVGIKNEIKLKEFIDNNETDILKKHLQYPNRSSLLYKSEIE